MERLTPEQRGLYRMLLAQGDLAGAGKPVDSAAFGRQMLHPDYVELVRKHVAGDSRSNPQDSAAFFERYRSPVALHTPLTLDDVPAPTVSSSREGTYDTLRYPALGDIPARTRVEFRPSANQQIKDALTGAGARLRALLSNAPETQELDAISGAAAKPRARK